MFLVEYSHYHNDFSLCLPSNFRIYETGQLNRLSNISLILLSGEIYNSTVTLWKSGNFDTSIKNQLTLQLTVLQHGLIMYTRHS